MQIGPAFLEPEYSFTPWDGPSYCGFAWLNRDRLNAMPHSEFLGLQHGLVGRSWTSLVDGLIVPYYFFTALALTSTFLGYRLSYWPRFSLRSLLTATTLVAVVLGLGVWLAS